MKNTTNTESTKILGYTYKIWEKYILINLSYKKYATKFMGEDSSTENRKNILTVKPYLLVYIVISRLW